MNPITGKILIVEDDKRLSKLLELYLKDFGYEILSIVASGTEAIDIVKRSSPDLVIMDIFLENNTSGIEAAEKMWNTYGIPVIYLTGHSEDEIISHLKHTEPFGFILKPPDPRHLKIAIEVALYKAKIEKKLLESKKWFEFALDSVEHGMIVVDNNGTIKYINKAAKYYMEQKNEDVFSGKLFTTLLGTLDKKTAESFGKLIFDVSSSLSYKEITIDYKNIFVSASPILDISEIFIGTAILIRNR